MGMKIDALDETLTKNTNLIITIVLFALVAVVFQSIHWDFWCGFSLAISVLCLYSLMRRFFITLGQKAFEFMNEQVHQKDTRKDSSIP